MVQRIVTELTDDIDGSAAEETVQFSLRNTSYEIDLSKENLGQLIRALEPFTTHGRKVSGRTSGIGRGSSRGAGREQLTAMRRWARENGHTVSDRGRVSAEIQNAYHAAH